MKFISINSRASSSRFDDANQIIMTILIGLETIYPSLKRSNAVKPVPGDAVPGRATVEGDAAESSPVSVSVGVLAPRERAEVSDM